MRKSYLIHNVKIWENSLPAGGFKLLSISDFWNALFLVGFLSAILCSLCDSHLHECPHAIRTIMGDVDASGLTGRWDGPRHHGD